MTQDEHQRATVTLERILATSPSAGDPKTTTTSKSRRPAHRLVLIPMAAALAVGAMVVPGLGGQSAAFASWSATPTTCGRQDLCWPSADTQGAISQFVSPQTASLTDGAVGRDVKGVTIHAGSLTVKATVHNRRYVAWWPGPAVGEGAQADSFLTSDLTLTDGTIVRNAQTQLKR